MYVYHKGQHGSSGAWCPDGLTWGKDGKDSGSRTLPKWVAVWVGDLNRGKGETCISSLGTHPCRHEGQCSVGWRALEAMWPVGRHWTLWPAQQSLAPPARVVARSLGPLAWEVVAEVWQHSSRPRLQQGAWSPTEAENEAEWPGCHAAAICGSQRMVFLSVRRNWGCSLVPIWQRVVRFYLWVFWREWPLWPEVCHSSKFYCLNKRPLSLFISPLILEFAYEWRWAAKPHFLFNNNNNNNRQIFKIIYIITYFQNVK